MNKKYVSSEDQTNNSSESPLPSVPEPEPEPTQESTEEKSETVIDVTEGNWKVYNEFIYYNPDENIWYCLQCRQVLESGKAAGHHVKETHGFKTKYIGKILNVQEATPDESKINRVESKRLEAELLGNLREEYSMIVDTADLALSINQKREAELVAALVKNPYVSYLFAKMKEQKLIYPSWNMADFFREGALVFAAMLGCYSDFGVNKDILKQNKHFSKIAVGIKRAWEEHDAEEIIKEQIVLEEKKISSK